MLMVQDQSELFFSKAISYELHIQDVYLNGLVTLLWLLADALQLMVSFLLLHQLLTGPENSL